MLGILACLQWLTRGKRLGKRSWPRRFRCSRGWRWRRNRNGRRRKKIAQSVRRRRAVSHRRRCCPLWLKEALHTPYQFLRLKRLADQFVGFHGNRFVGDALIDYAGHQHDRSFTVLRILLDLAADRVAVLIR